MGGDAGQVFVSIDAHALPDRPTETLDGIRAARSHVRQSASGSPRPSLEILTLGSTDLVVVDSLPDLSYVATGSSQGPGTLQHATAGLLPVRHLASWADLLRADPDRPFHAVVSLMLEPALAFALGDRLPSLLVRGLMPAVRERLVVCEQIDPGWAAPPETLDGRVLMGLDSAALLLVVRTVDLTSVARLLHVLRDLRASQVPQLDTDLALTRLRALPFPVPDPARALRETPLFGDVAADVGMAVELVQSAPGAWGRTLACHQGRAMRFPKASQGAGLVVADADTGAADWRGWTASEIAGLLAASGRHSHLVVRPWSRGYVAPLGTDQGVATDLTRALEAGRARWIPAGQGDLTAYEALKDAASRGHWAYGRTNASLSLTVELVELLADRMRIEGHTDLAEPLSTWVREAVASPRAGPDTRRAYRHLDRMMQARSGRWGDRSPGVRGYEARAGYVLLRDGFQAYLAELLIERGCGHITPVLVDGADTALRLKFGGALAYFEVSAQRLLNPVLWPAIAHEVEHLRLSRQREGVWGPALGAYLHRLPHTVHGLDPAVDNGPEGLFERLRRAHAAISLEPGWDEWVALAGAPLELAADLAIFDSSALGPDLPRGATEEQVREAMLGRWTRLLGTLWPNLAMDLRERQGGRPWSDNELLRLCQTLLFRFACTWVLAFFPIRKPLYEPLLEDDPNRSTTRAEVLGLLRSAITRGAAQPELLALVVEVTRPAGGELAALIARASAALRASVAPLTRLADAGQPLEPSERQLASIFAGALDHAEARRSNGVDAHGWPEMLALVHALRRPGRRGRVAGRAVAAFVERVERDCAEAPRIVPGAPHLPLAPRGGFTVGDHASRAQAAHLSDLIQALRGPIRDQRLRGLKAFLGCAVHGRVVLLAFRPEPRRYQRYLEHAIREGALRCGASLGEVVHDDSALVDELHALVGADAADGPLALLVDLRTERVAAAVLHPGLGDPETYGEANKVVQYLVDLLKRPDAEASPRSWCHAGRVYDAAVVRRLRELGLLGAIPVRPAQPDGSAPERSRPVA